MNPLSKYRNSPINIISIRYGKEDIIFNIAKAAKIDEDNIEAEIKGQPSHYAFLFVLHKRLLTKFEELKLRRGSIYGELLARAKERKNVYGRPLSDTASDKWIKSHKKYLRISEACIKARDEADQLLGAVRAFEMRANLMQTLSSNLRKQAL